MYGENFEKSTWRKNKRTTSLGPKSFRTVERRSPFHGNDVQKQEVASYCPKNEFGSAFNVPDIFPRFKPKLFSEILHHHREMVCRSTATLFTSGEGYGFVVDRATSDWRLSYGYGEIERSTAPIRIRRYDAVTPRRPRGVAIDPVGVAPRAAPPPPNPLHPGVPPYGQENYFTLGGGGRSIGVLKRQFTQPLVVCPPIAIREYTNRYGTRRGTGSKRNPESTRDASLPRPNKREREMPCRQRFQEEPRGHTRGAFRNSLGLQVILSRAPRCGSRARPRFGRKD
jgi:hypothetical protein